MMGAVEEKEEGKTKKTGSAKHPYRTMILIEAARLPPMRRFADSAERKLDRRVNRPGMRSNAYQH